MDSWRLRSRAGDIKAAIAALPPGSGATLTTHTHDVGASGSASVSGETGPAIPAQSATG